MPRGAAHFKASMVILAIQTIVTIAFFHHAAGSQLDCDCVSLSSSVKA
jgi:hypothetical protein